jgi:hypothetical protein
MVARGPSDLWPKGNMRYAPGAGSLTTAPELDGFQCVAIGRRSSSTLALVSVAKHLKSED